MKQNYHLLKIVSKDGKSIYNVVEDVMIVIFFEIFLFSSINYICKKLRWMMYIIFQVLWC